MRIELRRQCRIRVQILVLGHRADQRADIGQDRERTGRLIEQGSQLRHLRVHGVLDAVRR